MTRQPTAKRDRQGPLLLMVPLPPPFGGIATIGQMLHDCYICRPGFHLINTAKVEGRGNARRALRNPLLMVANIIRHRTRHVFAYASAGTSFWEKCGLMLLARMFGVRMTLMMVDGNFPTYFDSLPSALRLLGRRLLTGFDTVVAQSATWEAFYLTLAPAAHVVVVHGGVDTKFFQPVPTSGTGPPSVLFVGWVMDAKGLRELLSAAAQLRDENIEYELRIVGPDKGGEEWARSFLAGHGLENRVHLLGPILDRAALRTVYEAADIFAFPTHFEGFPNALLEAMACGLAPVATAVGGIPDIIEDGVSGLLIPDQDAESLAEALRRVIENDQLRSLLGGNARKRVLAEFSIEKSMRSYDHLFGHLMGSPDEPETSPRNTPD